ncbi:MAG: sulfurtransferase TusA family protein [Planctomycetes bacterium]|nr:sulfurtransferase TusA family protein [Planctomycetota bacterium]
MRDELLAHVRRRPCFSAGWKWASENERGNPAEPECLWRDVPAAATAASPSAGSSDAPPHDEDWDAGELGCGDLVLELRGRVMGLRPGQVLRINARDPGAPEDLPSWCRLTGHALVAAKHPLYWIRRKES